MFGKFITIEGCDGVGKTTQIELLKDELVRRGADFVFTREPGGTKISERIRTIISDPESEMDPYTELLLYAAARRQHTYEFIRRNLSAGKLVFCDRYVDSTVAYQGYGRGIDLDIIKTLNEIASGDTKIDLTLFIDLSPSDGFSRKGGADKSDRLECENADFYERVYRGYKSINATRIEVIDGKGTEREVHERIVSALVGRGIL